jgi:(R,R)-butanediol dehydrogenase/meso-butanediol dehydrogenase/diacetyl reductase
MSATMIQAAVWHGRGDVRVERRPVPPAPMPGSVRVAVAWCGICGSDLHEYVQGPVVIPRTNGTAAPIVLGHEFTGVVSAVGSDVAHFGVGDRVAVDTLVRCGRCLWCRRGDFNVCPHLDVVGLTMAGGFAELVDVPENTCYRVPDEIELDRAALAEPLSVALRAVSRGAITLATPTIVVGCGAIGLMCVRAAALAGAHPLVAIEPNSHRRALAGRAGADVVLEEIDAGAFSRAAPWAVLDCTAGGGGLPGAIASAPPQSRIVVVGVGPDPIALDAMTVLSRELTVVGSVSHNAEDFSAALSLLGRPEADLDWVISDRIALPSIARAFERLTGGDPHPVKILVTPREKS